MQSEEIAAIESQDSPTLLDGKGQDVGVGRFLITLTSFLNRQYVMPESTQLIDDWIIEVLIGIQSGHAGQDASLSRMVWSISGRWAA